MFGFRKKGNLLSLYAAEIVDEAREVLSWRRRQRRARLVLFLTYTVWILSGLLALLILNILIFLPGVKKIYWQSLSGKSDLAKASVLLSAGQWQELNQVSAEAQANFSGSLTELKKVSLSPIGWLPFTRGKIKDGIYLLQAASLISQSLAQSSQLVNDFSALLPARAAWDFSKLDTKQKRDLMKLIVASQSELEQAKNNLARAQDDLASIKNRQLIINQGIDLDELNSKLTTAGAQLDQALTLAKVLPVLGGYPEPTKYLFVLQNSDELRPTGGFIGTYGLARAADGELTFLQTSDVYHLDMPVKDKLKIEPPAELKKYLGVNYWYLRDANWSPDWPTSAQKIAWFYTQENNLLDQPNSLDDFQLVIGLTPKAIIDLLELTGPITVRGQTYNQTNFMALLQDTTGRDFPQLGLSSWDRKSIIGEITRAMQAKLLARLDKIWPRLLEIISANLDQKNILVYTTNQTIYDLLAKSGYRGELRSTNGDYLLVVDANLAAFKTDAVVNKSLTYSLQETGDGLTARVNINYANNGRFSWKTTTYRSFTRIYVPKGSELIKAAGYNGNQKDVIIGEELDKTYFGAFIEVAPGKLGGLSFEYKLPYNLYALLKNGRYDLLLQKQPGAKISELNLDLQFKRPIKTYEPAVFYSYATGSRWRYKSDFVTDKNFVLKF